MGLIFTSVSAMAQSTHDEDRIARIDQALNAAENASKEQASTTPAPEAASQNATTQNSTPDIPIQEPFQQAITTGQGPTPTAALKHGNSFKITGQLHTAVGIESNGHAVFTRANADLNERNFRLLSSSGLNDNINTYDPALYSSLKFVVDASVAQSVVSFHLNVSLDPWSYVGKGPKLLLTSANGSDTAQVQYLFWGNTGYTVNTIVNTLKIGDSFALPEVKVIGHDIVPPLSVTTTFGGTYNIPRTKITTTFQPVREVWFDIKPVDEVKLRVFPLAYENQALTTDDPLKLSNNREWWAESPWIDGWQSGILNTGATPVSFRQGKWDKSLSFFTRDSSGQRLTALRGISLDLNPTDETSWQTTIASPKTLWQDYAEINTVEASSRLKQSIGDVFYIGATADVHQGFNTGDLDAENYTGGVDSGLMLLRGVKVSGEYATSQSTYDLTQSAYKTNTSGNAYYAGIEYASNSEGMIKKDYFNYNPEDKTDNFFKGRVYFARMDRGFESSLSDFHGTRGDSYWADHLTFYPSDFRYLPGVVPGMSQYDLEPFAEGTGIDYGREVVAWRGDVTLLEDRLHGLLDVRHVTDDHSHDIETVSRTYWTFQATDKLMTKLLFISNDLPKTTAGIDPFLIEDNTPGTPFANTAVQGGKKPSLKTGSLGARYQATDWAAVNGVWEYTNDYNLGTNIFPQGILNSTFVGANINSHGLFYENTVPFIYSQGNFPQAPYPYYNIFKTGLELVPMDSLHIYLDYTRNPWEFAGNIDDNMNHYGIELSYVPTPKVGFFARYTDSQGYNINRLVNDNKLVYRNYQNFYFEVRMVLPKDALLSIQYGVGPAYNIATQNSNPSLAFYATTVLQTQHIVRIEFDKKF